ncbi:gluconate:H+ symporter [Niabella yanshanensis]|uniref:Gluconate:H+ symporter n=1 Tax=Niabella yanshanensis TaxID=577386 RepID=A0ABZ0W4K3_9BACT|nr:gluconate:H+ symporter [Niabella yanshanensis]WQD38178.1 gluconate:H+ symporter [Niabella yanshanensis]
MSPIILLILGMALLLLLITAAKLNAFLALFITTLFIGLTNGMQPAVCIAAMSKGVGDILGSVIVVLGFGVMLGSILTETGATRQISNRLLQLFGNRNAKLAVCVTSFSVGLALFYNAGFVVLIPLVFTIALETKTSLIYLAIAMAAPLSVTHGFLPPHPGPTAIASIFKADIGLTLLYGLCISVPVLALAGLWFPEWVKKISTKPLAGIFSQQTDASAREPGFAVSLFVALVPVILLAVSTVSLQLYGFPEGPLRQFFLFIGDPGMSLLVAVLLAIIFLGAFRGVKISMLMERSGNAVGAIAAIILITAAGGALKQVLIASGTAEAITGYFKDSTLPPLLLGWMVATVLRIAIGSATVAGLTAAGIVQPLVVAMHVNPQLMVLSIGAGSLMCSHVNDTGFWMFKEYLGLSLKDTFKSWTVMESVIGVAGLGGVLLLDLFV